MTSVYPDLVIPSAGCSPYQFGASLAAWEDELLVGAPYRYYAARADEGIPPPVAGLFRRAAGQWKLVEQLVAADPISSEGFARAVALGEVFATVGAPGYENGDGPVAYFSRIGDAPFQLTAILDSPDRQDAQADLFTEYGVAVACEGCLVFVGAPLENGMRGGGPACEGCGVVYVFDGLSGASVVTLRGNRPKENFGTALALSGDFLVVGAPGTYSNERFPGAAYVYRRDASGQWREVGRVEGQHPGEEFGAAVSVDGTRFVVGAPGRGDLPQAIGGRIDLFQLSDAGCALMSTVQEAPSFGHSVVLRGGRLVVGQPAFRVPAGPAQTGRVGLYRVNGAGALTREAWLVAGQPPEYANVGSAVALAHDYVAAGAPGLGEEEEGTGFVLVKEFAVR